MSRKSSEEDKSGMSKQALTKILLIEDDPDIQKVAKMALEAVGGFQVQICGSGPQALEEGPSFGPQLILLDVMMPKMDGATTFRKLRENPALSQVPVIFMTARVQTYEIENYKKMGALDVIRKPFDPMTLSRSIAEIWSRPG